MSRHSRKDPRKRNRSCPHEQSRQQTFDFSDRGRRLNLLSSLSIPEPPLGSRTNARSMRDVLFAIDQAVDTKDNAQPKLEEVAREVGKSKRAVRYAIDALVAAGLIATELGGHRAPCHSSPP